MGKLELNGWDKPEVRIVAHKHAPRRRHARSAHASTFEMVDGKIRIRTGVRVGDSFRPLPASGGAGIDLTVDAPRNVNLRAQTWAGDLDVSGFRAGAVLSSRGGEVHACDIDGEVRTNALRGKQRLSSIRGNVEADGVTGDVELDTIDGEVLEAKRGRRADRRARGALAAGAAVLVVGRRACSWARRAPGARYEVTAREGDVRLVLRARAVLASTRARRRAP